MGQANKRGTREERLAQKLGLVKRSLEDLKSELNIPADAVFQGYAVHLEEADEFLSAFEEGDGMTKKMWNKTPEFAKTFSDFSVAYDVSKKCANSVIVGVFETERQFWIGLVSE